MVFNYYYYWNIFFSDHFAFYFSSLNVSQPHTRESSDEALEKDTMASTCHDLIDPLNAPFLHPSPPISSLQPSIKSSPKFLTTPPYYCPPSYQQGPIFDPRYFHFYRQQIDDHYRRMSRSCLGLIHNEPYDFKATLPKTTDQCDSDDESIRPQTSKLAATKMNVDAQVHPVNQQYNSLNLQQYPHKSKKTKSHRKQQKRHQTRLSQPIEPLHSILQHQTLINPARQYDQNFFKEFSYVKSLTQLQSEASDIVRYHPGPIGSTGRTTIV